jgi:ribonuclease HII
VCGVDEAGNGAWAGPLIAAAIRLDYNRVDAETIARLADLNDCKRVNEHRRVELLPLVLEVADVSAVVSVSAGEIDVDGPGPAHLRAVARALETVAVAGSVNLVDWCELQDAHMPHQAVKGGDGLSAAIAAASIVAKVTRDQVMVELDKEFPGYAFAVHKGYGTKRHAKAIIDLGCLSPARRKNVRSKAYAELAKAA